jgi:polar amino acid transport system permease protein
VPMEELFRLLSFGPDGWGDQILAGTWLTIRLALVSAPAGFVLALLLAYGRDRGSAPVRFLGEAFVTVFRGLPELLTIFIIYYGAQMALTEGLAVLGLAPIEIGQFAAGALALTCVFAAFAADVLLASLRYASGEPADAARALGLKPLHICLFIELPLMLRHALPGLSNLWLALIRDTSLVSVIALVELTRASRLAAAATREPFLFYGIACLIYLALSLISAFGLARLQRLVRRGIEEPR